MRHLFLSFSVCVSLLQAKKTNLPLMATTSHHPLNVTTHNQPLNQSTHIHQREISPKRDREPTASTPSNPRPQHMAHPTTNHRINRNPQINSTPTNQSTPWNQPSTYKSTHTMESTHTHN